MGKPWLYRSNPEGGQLSNLVPNTKPLEANTSLISLSDLRPKLGVFNNSVSVF